MYSQQRNSAYAVDLCVAVDVVVEAAVEAAATAAAAAVSVKDHPKVQRSCSYCCYYCHQEVVVLIALAVHAAVVLCASLILIVVSVVNKHWVLVSAVVPVLAPVLLLREYSVADVVIAVAIIRHA